MDAPETNLDLENELVMVNKAIYLKKILKSTSSLKFSLPKEITTQLNLKPKDKCYFYRTELRYYITFHNPPEGIIKANYKCRKLSQGGAYNTLSVLIPQFITYEIPATKMQYVRLTQPKGLPKDQWQIEFLSSE